MGKLSLSTKLRIVGIINIIIGSLVAFWMLTAGLVMTLYAADMNKTPSVFFGLVIALVFAGLYLKGGIGIIRTRARSRIYLNIPWGISILLIAGYIFQEIRYGFSSDGIGSEFFDIWSWLGGIIFCSVLIFLGILHIRFLNSSKVKELLVR